jgi:DNA (cytosine-5)-methyltransferase 1
MRELALFAGAGGGILGGKLLGWRTVCAVERDAYASQVLAQRQNDGILEPFPIWSDITTFDGKPWKGIVDVVSGGFPCQDISAAGKGAGIEGTRSGMWKEMARIIGEVRPQYAFVENSPMLTTRGLGAVLTDLASMGYDAEWGVLSAADVGALHKRERIWVLASDNDCKHVERGFKKKVFRFSGLQGELSSRVDKNEHGLRAILTPGLCRKFNGLPSQVDKLRAIGNAQLPIVAATAFELLRERLNENAD